MTYQEYVKTEKRFGKLFDRICKVGYSNLTEDEKQEYNMLRDALIDNENTQIFYENIASGDYRIGY